MKIINIILPLLLLNSISDPNKNANPNLVTAQITCPGGTEQTCQQLCAESAWTCRALQVTVGIEVCDAPACLTACNTVCNN